MRRHLRHSLDAYPRDHRRPRYFGHDSSAVDGGRERDAGLVFGWGALPRSGGGYRARARSWLGRGRRSSTSGANRLGRGRRRSPSRRSCGGCVPVVAGLAGVEADISVDTSKAAVAEAALDAGAAIVNDVTALRGDPEMAALCADRGATVVLMHMAGSPRTMQRDPVYGDVVGEVKAFLAERMEAALAAGVDEERIWLDPGIGFGKTAEHNFELLRRLAELCELGRPLVVGTSRKSFIGRVDGSDSSERLGGTIASSVLAAAEGAEVLRVHDVAEIAQALRRRHGGPRVGCREMEAHGQRHRVERRGRAARPLDLHPSRGERRRAGGRAAARVRHLLRRARLRRDAHRPARGHGRLRPGLRHRRPRRDRAQLQDPGAPGAGRRRSA